MVSTMGKAPSKMSSIKEALEENSELWAKEEEVEALAAEWAVKCLVHSMGVSILQAGRAFTGCRDEDLGVAIEVKEGKAPLIWLYDRTNKGNGATSLLNRFFQIPKALKHLREHPIMSDTNKKLASLPSKDFMGVLLDFLRPCRNHEGGVVSMEIGRSGRSEAKAPGMGKLLEKTSFLLRRYREEWDGMGFDMNEARRVSLMRHFECERDPVRNDELKKATEFCWTSCPICLEEMGVSPLGPLTGPLYYNKRQLDRYVAGALTASNSMVERELSNDSIRDISSQFGAMDTDVVPIDFRESGLGINPQIGSAEGSYVLRPLREVDLVQQFVDCSNPVKEDGSVNIRVRAIVTDSSWGKA